MALDSRSGSRPVGPGQQPAQRTPNPETTATLQHGIPRPLVEETLSSFPVTSQRLLDVLRQTIAKATIQVNESGIETTWVVHQTDWLVYSNLHKNLQGVWKLSINDTVFLFGRTRTTWFVLYDKPHETIYDMDPRFMDIDLKKRDIISLENGKRMYLSRIERSEVNLLNAMAAQGAAKKAQEDTLDPEKAGLSMDELVSRLRHAKLEHSTDIFFEMPDFASSIKFVTTMQDEKDNSHYYIIAGEKEKGYYLYVYSGKEPQPPQNCTATTRFAYKSESCIMYQED